MPDLVVAPINHISLDERGRAFISGTSMKVANIVIDAYRWKMSPQEIRDNYPSLSLAEIHAALAYYHDHSVEIDGQIAESDRAYETLRRSHPNKLSRKVLEARIKPAE